MSDHSPSLYTATLIAFHSAASSDCAASTASRYRSACLAASFRAVLRAALHSVAEIPSLRRAGCVSNGGLSGARSGGELAVAQALAAQKRHGRSQK